MARERGQSKPPNRTRLQKRFRDHFRAVKDRVAALSLQTPAEAASVAAFCAAAGAYPDPGILSAIGLGAVGSLWANYLSKSGQPPADIPADLLDRFLAHDDAQREILQFLQEYDLQSVVIDEFGPEALSQLKAAVGEALDERDLAKREHLAPLEAGVGELLQRVTPSAPAEPDLPIFSLPHPRNPNFTGRADLLTSLRRSLTAGGHAALTHAVHGLGGVGKTQLALEYVYRHRDHYPVVYWVRSEEPAQLSAGYADLAGPLNLPEKDAQDQTITAAAVRRWLEHNDGWLLIFDNAPHPDAVRGYLPRGGSGHIIITSRDPNWSAVAVTLDVPDWPRDESIAFLEKRTGHGGDEADALANELGDLPLALEQAAAYIEAAGIALTEYLDLFRTRREELWQHEKPPADYDETTGTTWSLNMTQVAADMPAATDLLNLCAFLAPDDIPLSLFRDHADHLPEPLKSTVADPLALNNAVASLRRYSLLQKEGDAISLHRLVQAVARDRLPEEREKEWAAAAAAIVNAAFPAAPDDVRFRSACADLLPHALAAASYAEELGVAVDEAVYLLNHAGLYLKGRAAFDEATSAFERGLRIFEKVLGRKHPNVATLDNNLAGVLWAQGDLAGARERYQRALEIDLAAFGPDHPSVAIRLDNLAGVLQEQGDLAGAQERFERALEIDLEAYGPEHPSVAVRLDNLAGVLQEQGNLAGARECFEQALKIDMAAYGPKHPEVATALNNLAMVLQDQGDLAGARERYEQALQISLTAYGPEHPKVATALNNLGSVAFWRGDYEDARQCVQRALDVDEAIHGSDRPSVALRVSNLGDVAWAMGDLSAAKAHYERALSIFQHFLGDEHPNTQRVRRNLESLTTSEGSWRPSAPRE